MEAKGIIARIDAGEKRIAVHAASHDEAIAIANALRSARAAARVEYFSDRLEVWDNWPEFVAERWMVAIQFDPCPPLEPPVRVDVRAREVIAPIGRMVHPVTATLVARFGRPVTRSELAAAIAAEIGYCATAAAPGIPPRGECPSRAAFAEGRDPGTTSDEWTLYVATSDVDTARRIDFLRAE